MGLVETTTYRVETQMVAKDEATAVFRAVERSANVAIGAIDRLKGGLALLGVGLGFSEAKKRLIDFNAELEDSRVVMAGMLTMFTGSPIEKAWDRAGQSVETFNKMAAKSSLTTKELVNLASMIERPLLQAGVRIGDIEKITFGAANAAKAFGISPEVASMDIQQALSSGVHIKDRFLMSLLAQTEIGYTADKFNALSASGKVRVLQQATETKAILDMAKKQGEDTLHGVVSTLEDNVSMLGGRIGMPLFKAVTAEVQNWNAWMEKNSVTIDRIARTLGQDLVSGFKYVKDVFQFLYDRGDTLISLGKVWAAVRISGMIGGGGLGWTGNGAAIAGAFQGAGGSMVKTLGESFRAAILSVGIRFPSMIGPMNAMGNFGSMLGRLGGAAGALGPGGIIGIGYAAHELGEYLGVHKALTRVIDPTRARLESLKASMEVLEDTVKRTAQSMGGEKGALGSVIATNALGVVDYMKDQINILQDIQSGRIKPSALGADDVGKALKSVGFDDDDIRQKNLRTPQGRLLAISQLYSRSASVGSTTYAASHQTDIGIEAAMKMMTDSERSSIDTKKATTLVMQKFVELFNTSGYGMWGLNAALMSPEEIKKMLLKDALDPFKSASINQNITNNIKVEVSAKDPDRWIMELDQKVQRKIRAPTQAKGSIITRGGL